MAKQDDAPVGDPEDVDAQIATLYGGPLATFVERRAVLARSLRSAGRREDADRVKALKKPKLAAWALDAGAHAEPAAVAELASAVDNVTETQSDGGDVRSALARLRAAEAVLIDAARDATARHDHPVDPTALGSALRAVVGDPDAMAALVAGNLVDAPTGGGLGLAVPDARRERRAGRPAPSAAPSDRGADTPATDEDHAAISAARRAVTDAERAAEAAQAAARDAGTDAEAADAAARDAEAEAVAARRRADTAHDAAVRARREADARGARHDEAAAGLESARAALRSLEA
jgi:hypothetical protein